MTSVPQTPDGKHIAVAKLVGAGLKPAPTRTTNCECNKKLFAFKKRF
jgi:hypothetical protein